MANNRMWLRCDHCKEEYLLAKYYPKLTDGWFVPTKFDPRDDVPLVERFAQKTAELGEFLEKHSFCPTGARTMIGNTAFSLRFEETA